MTAFLAANLAPIMFAGLVVFLLLGFPVTFALGALGLSFGLIGIQLGLLNEALYLRRQRDQWRDAAVWIANLWAAGVEDPRVSRFLLEHACRAAQAQRPRRRCP